MANDWNQRWNSSYPIDWVLLPLEDDRPFKSPIQPLEGVTVTIVPTHHGVLLADTISKPREAGNSTNYVLKIWGCPSVKLEIWQKAAM